VEAAVELVVLACLLERLSPNKTRPEAIRSATKIKKDISYPGNLSQLPKNPSVTRLNYLCTNSRACWIKSRSSAQIAKRISANHFGC